MLFIISDLPELVMKHTVIGSMDQTSLYNTQELLTMLIQSLIFLLSTHLLNSSTLVRKFTINPSRKPTLNAFILKAMIVLMELK